MCEIKCGWRCSLLMGGVSMGKKMENFQHSWCLFAFIFLFSLSLSHIRKLFNEMISIHWLFLVICFVARHHQFCKCGLHRLHGVEENKKKNSQFDCKLKIKMFLNFVFWLDDIASYSITSTRSIPRKLLLLLMLLFHCDGCCVLCIYSTSFLIN